MNHCPIPARTLRTALVACVVMATTGTLAHAAAFNINDMHRNGSPLKIGANDFEGGLYIDGELFQIGLRNVQTMNIPSESFTFDGVWIDLGRSLLGSRTVYFVEPDSPDRVSDILIYTVSRYTSSRARIAGSFVSSSGSEDLGLVPEGTDPESIWVVGGGVQGGYEVPMINSGHAPPNVAYLGMHVWTETAATNAPPSAAAGDDQSIRAGQTVYLDGTGSFDDNTASEALGYSWSFSMLPDGSGATLSGADTATPTFVADVAGTYEVSLVVTDEGGLSSPPDTVSISSNNVAPTAVATVDYDIVILGHAANFDGSTSSDPENDALTYSWTLTGAPAESAAVLMDADTPFAMLTPDVVGEYEVTLEVSDFLGPGAPVTVTFTATTASEYAEIKIIAASDDVAALSADQVTTKGNQTALKNFLRQSMTAIQESDAETAIHKLQESIERCDGCALRGEPDGNGPGRDWITVCAAQTDIYNELMAALEALTQ